MNPVLENALSLATGNETNPRTRRVLAMRALGLGGAAEQPVESAEQIRAVEGPGQQFEVGLARGRGEGTLRGEQGREDAALPIADHGVEFGPRPIRHGILANDGGKAGPAGEA